MSDKRKKNIKEEIVMFVVEAALMMFFITSVITLHFEWNSLSITLRRLIAAAMMIDGTVFIFSIEKLVPPDDLDDWDDDDE